MAANAEAAATKGALRTIYNGQMVDNPVFQCIHIKPLNSANAPGSPERYRVVFSDVSNFIQSMLTTQLNHMIQDETLSKGCFVRIKAYTVNEVKGKKILIILDCETLTELGIHEKIGEPEALELKEGVKAEEDSKQGISSNGFYGNKAQAQTAPQASARSLPSRSNNTSSTNGVTMPIEALSPYAHKWTIKARCTHKSDIKTWHNRNGEGKLFSVTFLDESGEIRATGFNDQCDMLYDIFQEGGVYYVSSPCKVQMAKKQFSNVNNDYELTFESGTVVEKAEDEINVPQVRYSFTTIGDLQSVDKDTTIDTVGILKELGEVNQITSKTTSKPYDKRDLTLVDKSGMSVRLTIWGKAATTFMAPLECVVAFKGVKVSDFNGRSLSLLSSGSMTVDPDIDEAHELKGWYDAQGRQDTFTSHAQTMGSAAGTGRKDQFKTVSQVRDEQLGMNPETPDYFTLKATVVFVKSSEKIAYAACQTETCKNKSVVEQEVGQWLCDRCEKTWSKPLYRYVLAINVADHTGQLWISCFDEVGRMVMDATADEMMDLKENDAEDKSYGKKVSEANCRTWIFRCRAKMDTFQQQERVRYQASSAAPLNFSAECSKLADLIKQYDVESDNSLFVH